ncbi:MAG: hypothetical protein LBR85_07830 [Oscillospiraceae bacterium]|jgi:hypothetical protein|nr:hypothetical protein [Oscillospiraceae bacterium]
MHKIFRRKIEPRCAYCARGLALDGSSVICKRHGAVSSNGKCGAFVYDPLKRVPPPQVSLGRNYTDEDMKL